MNGQRPIDAEHPVYATLREVLISRHQVETNLGEVQARCTAQQLELREARREVDDLRRLLAIVGVDWKKVDEYLFEVAENRRLRDEAAKEGR